MHDNLHPPFPLPSVPTSDDPLTELFPEFVQAWIADLERDAADMISRRDAEALYRLGHTIKGSFLQFRLSEHATVGRQIMDFAERSDWTSADTYVKALLQMLRSLQQSLDHSS